VTWKKLVKKLGNCYQSAYSYVFDKAMKGDKNLILVHADVIGTGKDVKGVCYGHAFVLDGNMVRDTEAKADIPYQLYKALGQITNEKRYTFEEMLQEAMKSGHYGPW
tara:strand:+ start:194 stop:514 length:321 start_codon:yes stop_codon:yes gene_type:complete